MGQSLLSREVERPSDNTDGSPLPRMQGLGGTLFTRLAVQGDGQSHMKASPNATLFSFIPQIINTGHL